MKTIGKLFITLIFLSGMLVISSCSKEDQDTPGEIGKTTVKDYINMVNAFTLSTEEDITSEEDNGLKSAMVFDCLTVTVHENENGEFWPRSWTLDYGTENCECYFGNSKRGKIHVKLSDWWRNEGSLREITFEDFYFNDNKLEGVKTIQNTGLNDDGNLTFKREIDGGKLTYPDGSSISWSCEKISELIEGNETMRFFDDVWSVTGSGSGVNIDKVDYFFEIVSPLIYKNGCFYPVSGVVEISTKDNLQVIDYGNGECDNIITVTENGVCETIEL